MATPDDPFTILSGPWDGGAIEGFLGSTVIPVRLATNGRSGPLVQSLWFVYDDGVLWCCSQVDSLVVIRLRRDPACAFEIAGDQPPYRGVRGQGRVELLPESAPDVLPRLLDRYLGGQDSSLASWLLSRVDSEVAIRIGGLRVTSWDFAPRMDADPETP